MAAAILVSFHGIINFNYPYNFSIVIYIVFFIIRSIILLIILLRIFFLIVFKFSNIFTKIILFLLATVYLLPLKAVKVNQFYQIKLLFNYYFIDTSYAYFWLELLCTILFILFSYFVYKMILLSASRKKGDII